MSIEKTKRLQYFRNKLAPELEIKHLIKSDEFNHSSFRLTSENSNDTIDYYPKALKIFVHSTEQWHNVDKFKVKETILKLMKES